MNRKRTILIIVTALLLLFTGSLCVHGNRIIGKGKAVESLMSDNQNVSEISMATGRSSAFSSSGTSDECKVELISCTPDETRLRFHLGRLSVANVEVDGSSYSLVEARGCAISSRAGEPELPVFRFEVAADEGAECIVERCLWDETEVAPPLPSRGAYWRSFGFEGDGSENREIYGGGGVYPSEVACIQSTYRLRGVSGAGVLLRPVCYDFDRGVLRAATSLEVCVRNAKKGGAQVLDANASFANLQSGMFENASVLSYSDSSSDANPIGKLLMVLPDEWIGAEQAFVSWKRNVGFDVKVCRYPEDTGTGSDALAAFIRSEYNESGITHIILCGDCDDVPPAYTSTSTQRPGTKKPTSDTQYAYLSGDDCVADVFISRVPAHSAEQLDGVLSKIVSYEANPPLDDSWRSKPLIMCSTEASSSGIYKNISDYTLLKNEYDGLVSAGVFQNDESRLLCDDSSTSENVATALNGEGTSLFIYLGHGKYDSYVVSGKRCFGVSDATSLQNGLNLPFVLAPVCDSGNFAYNGSDSLSEAFFLNGQFTENGAIAVVAATSDTLWNPPIKAISEFSALLKKAYSSERCLCAGELYQKAMLAGILLADSEQSSIYDKPGEIFANQMHLFGDCTMMPRLRMLRPANVDATLHDEGTLAVSVKWSDDGTPVKGAYVSVVSREAKLSISTVTDDTGNAAVKVCGFGNDVTLLVNDATFRPYSSNIAVNGMVWPDADGDGFVTNQELLAFLKHTEVCADCQSQVEQAIELWKNDNLPRPVDGVSPTGRFLKAVDTGFNSYGNIIAEMDSLATQFCDICRVEYIGQTAEGRDILGLCICAGDETDVPHLLIAAGTACSELNSPQIALHLARFLLKDKTIASKAAFHIVPLLEPDEWEAKTPSGIGLSERMASFFRWLGCIDFTTAVVLSSGKANVICPSVVTSESSVYYREFAALRQAWIDNSSLFSNSQENGYQSAVVDLLKNYNILGIEANLGLSNQLDIKELQSLCTECETPFSNWCNVATTGMAVSLADDFPLSETSVPCKVLIDGRNCGLTDDCDTIVWLSKGRKWFRTLVKGEHDIDVCAVGTHVTSSHFAVLDDVTKIRINLSLVDGSPIQGIAFTPRRFVPGQTHLLETEYICSEGGALIWKLDLPDGWSVAADSAYASRLENDGSVSLLFLDVQKQGRLKCRIRAHYGETKNGNNVFSSLLWHACSSDVRFLLQPQAQRTVAMSLESGWNLIGSTITAAVPQGLKAWSFDGKFLETALMLPGHAFWLFSDKNASLSITGWDANSYINVTKSGWSLISPMRHTRAGKPCFEYSSEARCYRRVGDVLKPGKAYWIFGD